MSPLNGNYLETNIVTLPNIRTRRSPAEPIPSTSTPYQKNTSIQAIADKSNGIKTMKPGTYNNYSIDYTIVVYTRDVKKM